MRLGQCAQQGKFDRNNQIRYAYKNFSIMEDHGVQFDLSGLEFLSDEDGPFVIAANHMSSIETFVLNSMISPRVDFTFVIKNTLFDAPFFGHAMRAIHAIGVDRKSARDDFKVVMQQGCEHLHNGKSVLIFPESTRQDQFRTENFNSIAVKLARRAKVKIIPLALKTDIMNRGKIFSMIGTLDLSKTIHFAFGKPLEVTAQNEDEVHNTITQFIAEKHDTWQK